jgi:hypothetical protein
MLPQAGGRYNHKITPSPSRSNVNWLNLVLDLNGILCICQEKRLMPKEHAYVDSSRPHFSTFSYFLGPKAIFDCLSYQRFLRKHDNVADITI